jgi:hypothetical protein
MTPILKLVIKKNANFGSVQIAENTAHDADTWRDSNPRSSDCLADVPQKAKQT